MPGNWRRSSVSEQIRDEFAACGILAILTRKITAVAMKKALFILLGLIGVGLVGYSVSQGWAGLELPIAGLTIKEPGYKFLQGMICGGAALIGFALLFIKPKIGAIFGVLAALAALWLYLSPPVIEEMAYEPQKAIFMAIGGGAALALAGLVAPSKK